MHGELIALRILHIGGGVFWVGTTLFAAFFLEPSVSAAGPAGGEVMKRLNATRFHPVMITLTLLTLPAKSPKKEVSVPQFTWRVIRWLGMS